MELRPSTNIILRNVAVYGIAILIIWYEFRGLRLHYLLGVLASANLLWFIPTTICSFAVWFFGENLLFSRLFSYFHQPTGYRELLPATAAAYFLQIINLFAAGGAFALFLHNRKGATWLGATFTLLFLGFIDGCVLSLLMILSGVLFNSPVRAYLPYSAALFGCLVGIATWWMWRRPVNSAERWLRERPALVSFRTASPRIYLTLGVIRLGIFLPQALAYYFSMLAFHIGVPFIAVLAVTPAIIAVGGLPITPVGLGPLQAVAVEVFSPYSSTTRVLAAYLALSVALLVYRLPLGLGAASAYTRAVMGEQGQPDVHARS